MMKKLSIKYLPLLGIAILILVIGAFMLKTGHEDLQEKVFTDIVLNEGLKDINFIRDNPDDGTKWELDAREIKSSKDGELVQLDKFKFRMESAEGLFFEMVGDSAEYNRKEGHLTSNEEVRVTGSFFVLSGKGLFVDLENGVFRILSNVDTVIEKGFLDL